MTKAIAGKQGPGPAAAAKAPQVKSLTDGQRAYEARRAAKAGMSLEKWLAAKDREAAAEARARARDAEPPKAPKPPGLLSRLIDRAHKPLKPVVKKK